MLSATKADVGNGYIKKRRRNYFYAKFEIIDIISGREV